MTLRISTTVEVEKDTWTISHTYDETEVLKQAREDRNSGEEGRIDGGKAKCIARIPRHRFDSDIELQMALSCQGKDKAEYEKWIRLWLMRNPEFRTTTGKTKVYL